MAIYNVVISHRANRRLTDLYNYIADSGSPVAAITYVRRIRDMCAALAEFPERGVGRPDLGKGLRAMTMDRRVTIIYRVQSATVTIVTVAYAGRDFMRELKSDR